MVELAGAGICLNLPVPGIGGKLLEPRLEVGELLWGKTTDGGLKLLNAHGGRTLPRENSPGKVRGVKPPNESKLSDGSWRRKTRDTEKT